MPPPRRSSPRRKDRRSRSRSPSRERRRSRSPREKRRSRSPYKKRSRSRERGSSPKRRSPERSSPARRKSLGTKRRSSSPHGYDQPVKRQADSTRRTYRSKSRSHSPVPQKKSRDSRRDDSPPEKVSSRRRSPSPLHSSKYSDHPSSSKSSDRRSSKKDEIDFVKIVDMGSKLPKLNKRFQTLEQLAQGGFEFEENITIGIHRGPSHLDLDEDVPVNYDFNPKLFIMLHPKKDYTIPVFERDEILAFHHDDVLDEEAYVEKRTITVKPSDKPKPTTSRSDNSRYKDIDYKITIGSSRESHGDRRMVHDSGSRSSRYDPEVKIRLDARPDPKYERLYKESRRQEERDLLDDNIQRNPSDLRYNLMRKKSSDDDRDRDRSRGRESYGDARARIEAKRKALSDRYDGSRDQSPPPTRLEKRKIGIKTELPDFKNRPGKPIEKPAIWIIGSSVVEDISETKWSDKCPSLTEQMGDCIKSIRWHGKSDMKISELLENVQNLLNIWAKPDIVIFQCGEYDICTGRNIDHQTSMREELVKIREKIPGVKFVWSQTFPPWMASEPVGSSLAKSRRRINCFMMKLFCSEEVDGAFLYHPHFRTNRKSKFYKNMYDGFLHLNEVGLKMYLMQLKAGIKYIMLGKGNIYPYIKWPPKNIRDIPPDEICMLCKEHILDINEDMLLAMSPEQIQQFSIDQIKMFQPIQIKWLYCKFFIKNLSPDQVAACTKEEFKIMNLEQVTNWLDLQGSLLSPEMKEFLIKKEKKLRKKKNKQEHVEMGDEFDGVSSDEDFLDFDDYEDERYEYVEVRDRHRQGRDRGPRKGRGRGRGGGHGRGGGRGRGLGRGRGRGGFENGRYDDGDRGRGRREQRRSKSYERDNRRDRRRSRSGRRERRRSRSFSSESFSSESDYSRSRSRSRGRRSKQRQTRNEPPQSLYPNYPGFPVGPPQFPLQPPVMPPGYPIPIPPGYPPIPFPYMPSPITPGQPQPPGTYPASYPYHAPGQAPPVFSAQIPPPPGETSQVNMTNLKSLT